MFNSNVGGIIISGANTDTYTFTVNNTSPAYYYVIVSNTFGNDTSSVYILEVQTLIIQQPQDVISYIGTFISFTILATYNITDPDSIPNYKWYSNTINSNSGGTVITGAISDTYAFTISDTSPIYYYVEVFNSYNFQRSSVAKLQVLPTIFSQPQNIIATLGSDVIFNSVVIFNTVDSNTINSNTINSIIPSKLINLNSNSTPTYQWYSNTINSSTSGKLIDGANTYIYNLIDVNCKSPIYYYLKITNQYGTTTSSVVQLVLITTKNIKVRTKINQKVQIVLKGQTMTNNKFKYLISSYPSHGEIFFFVSNEVIYTPKPNYTGCDKFSYYIEDTDGNKSNISDVYIKIKNTQNFSYK
jgi:hypothetical protein